MRRLLSYAFLSATLASIAACSGSSSTSPSPTPAPSPTVTSVSISGSNSIKDGETASLSATATKSDNSTQSVTGLATWQSSNTAVATVSASGVVSAKSPGTTTISAAYSGRTGQITVTVTAVDNIQTVSVSVDRFVVDGTCDGDSIFEDTIDGEFELRFELERSGTGRSSIWSTSGTYTKGAHNVSAGFTFNRNVSRGEDFTLWFTATENDGLLGADSRLDHRSSGRNFTYSNGAWRSNGSTGASIPIGSGSCGVTVFWTLTSRDA